MIDNYLHDWCERMGVPVPHSPTRDERVVLARATLATIKHVLDDALVGAHVALALTDDLRLHLREIIRLEREASERREKSSLDTQIYGGVDDDGA